MPQFHNCDLQYTLVCYKQYLEITSYQTHFNKSVTKTTQNFLVNCIPRQTIIDNCPGQQFTALPKQLCTCSYICTFVKRGTMRLLLMFFKYNVPSLKYKVVLNNYESNPVIKVRIGHNVPCVQYCFEWLNHIKCPPLVQAIFSTLEENLALLLWHCTQQTEGQTHE